MKRPLLALAAALILSDEGGLIDAMDRSRFLAPREKGAAELVEGKVGKAVRFRFDADSRGIFATSNIHGTPEWDRAAGFSFWVKGDGRDGFGGLQFIHDEDYAVRYDLCFPIKGEGWSKVVIAWDDLIPALPGPKALPLRAGGGNPPSKLSGLWFGRWWYWGDYPAISFAVDEIRLESSIERDRRDYRPAGAPLGRVLAALKAGRPITVVTMGDSLTDKLHWSNRQACWVDLLRDRLRAIGGSDVTVVNPAIGGTQLRQNLVLLPRWLDRAPEPDLVTIFFGGNDREAGMRGEEFETACADAVDQVRRATRGKADVLLMTTCPSVAGWTAPPGLAVACRDAARARGAGLADIDAAFRADGKGDPARLFVHDRVHLSPQGHEAVAGAVFGAIEASGP